MLAALGELPVRRLDLRSDQFSIQIRYFPETIAVPVAPCCSILGGDEIWVPHPRRVFVFAPRVGTMKSLISLPSATCKVDSSQNSKLGFPHTLFAVFFLDKHAAKLEHSNKP
jgi:hypothetical protein